MASRRRRRLFVQGLKASLLAAPLALSCGTSTAYMQKDTSEIFGGGELARLCGRPEACTAACDEVLRRAQTQPAGTWCPSDACEVTRCEVYTGAQLNIDCECPDDMSDCDTPEMGRRPAGLSPCAPTRGSALGRFFARAAWLEAASVHAFAHLAGELARHGAPARLIVRAHAALHDEVDHARRMLARATAHGAEVPAPEVAPSTAQTLEALARDNAVAGALEERYSARVLAHAARKTRDRALGRSLTVIARDEREHGRLALAIDRWAMRRLDAAARARVGAARRDAKARLVASAGATRGDELELAGLGLPDPRARRWLAARMS